MLWPKVCSVALQRTSSANTLKCHFFVHCGLKVNRTHPLWLVRALSGVSGSEVQRALMSAPRTTCRLRQRTPHRQQLPSTLIHELL